jgi:hypothetical protein
MAWLGFTWCMPNLVEEMLRQLLAMYLVGYMNCSKQLFFFSFFRMRRLIKLKCLICNRH